MSREKRFLVMCVDFRLICSIDHVDLSVRVLTTITVKAFVDKITEDSEINSKE